MIPLRKTSAPNPIDALFATNRIRCANLAIPQDPACAAAHRRWLATEFDTPEAKTAAKREWLRLAMNVFDREMAR
jgi:hypothetical protein